VTGRLDLACGVCIRRRGLAHVWAGAFGAGSRQLLSDLGGLRYPFWPCLRRYTRVPGGPP
jgi:hypothetical protein